MTATAAPFLPLDDLSALSPVEIDALPFGYIALSPEGEIRKYNRYEAELSGRDPEEVLGKNFFREVAPCTAVREFEGRFRQFASASEAEGSLSFEFTFRFRHGTRKVRIGLVRSPLPSEIIVTVNRVRDLGLPTELELRPDPVHGTLRDAAGRRVTLMGEDFWQGLLEVVTLDGARHSPVQAEIGKRWARRHTARLERFVQERHGRTLRETELQLALGTFSQSLGLLGLGRFEVDLDHRDHGLLVVLHSDSPLTAQAQDDTHPSCSLLAGLHAGIVGYLAGRELTARELRCSRGADEVCVFVVGTEERLDRLFSEEPTPRDAALLREISSIGATRSAEAGKASS